MRLRVALPLAGICVLFASCGGERQATAPRPTPKPIIDAKVTLGTRAVTDMTGRELHVPEFVNRVVAITPSAADFALALGLELVGRTSDSAGTAVASTTTVGSSLSPDFNAIAALKPDLVIGDTAYDGARLRDFERFAYPVFLLRVSSYEDAPLALGALGDATARTQQGRACSAPLRILADLLYPH